MRGRNAAKNEHCNYEMPGYAECVQCLGEGRVHNPRAMLVAQPAYLNCPDCAGTGRQPIPITEVIRGLRRGDEGHRPGRADWLYMGCGE